MVFHFDMELKLSFNYQFRDEESFAYLLISNKSEKSGLCFILTVEPTQPFIH